LSKNPVATFARTWTIAASSHAHQNVDTHEPPQLHRLVTVATLATDSHIHQNVAKQN
jgi:hypothetical protein